MCAFLLFGLIQQVLLRVMILTYISSIMVVQCGYKRIVPRPSGSFGGRTSHPSHAVEPVGGGPHKVVPQKV